MSLGLVFGAMLAGAVGFILVTVMVIAFGACVGGAIGHAMYRFEIWRTLNQGGKVGCVLGILVATPVAIYLGSLIGVAIGIGLGERLAANAGALMGVVPGFTLTMETILVVGFGVGGAIGQVIYRFFDLNPHESVA
jgi:hypothetical protein